MRFYALFVFFLFAAVSAAQVEGTEESIASADVDAQAPLEVKEGDVAAVDVEEAVKKDSGLMKRIFVLAVGAGGIIFASRNPELMAKISGEILNSVANSFETRRKKLRKRYDDLDAREMTARLTDFFLNELTRFSIYKALGSVFEFVGFKSSDDRDPSVKDVALAGAEAAVDHSSWYRRPYWHSYGYGYRHGYMMPSFEERLDWYTLGPRMKLYDSWLRWLTSPWKKADAQAVQVLEEALAESPELAKQFQAESDEIALASLKQNQVVRDDEKKFEGIAHDVEEALDVVEGDSRNKDSKAAYLGSVDLSIDTDREETPNVYNKTNSASEEDDEWEEVEDEEDDSENSNSDQD